MYKIYSICTINVYVVKGLTGDTHKIFVPKTVDESNWARVLISCKPTIKG